VCNFHISQDCVVPCPEKKRLQFLPRDASAERSYEIACHLSICLSVRLSVRDRDVRYRDHISWNSSKIIHGQIA